MKTNKLTLLISCIFLLFAALAMAAPVEPPADCKYCGMDRSKFSHSRMLITYVDGSSTGTCSINCTGVDRFANREKKVASYQVGEYTSRKLIDAKSGVWVIGGKKRGVMTPVAKWAFADKKSANAFIRENGGKLATFDDALKATEKELADEERSHSHEHRKHEGHGH